MRQLHFFALREDLLPVLEAIEHEIPLKYVLMGQATQVERQSFNHAVEIPNLGYAITESASSGLTFLVTGRDMPIKARPIKTALGTSYLFDQLDNPDTITFSPGGIWGDDVILSGRVATVSESPFAKDLMKRFNRNLKKRFDKIKAFSVGQAASALLDAGRRLTASAQSPRQFDLSRIT